MAKRNRKEEPDRLRGWQQIAKFLGQPVAVAQRWAKSDMPVRREGRYVTATPDELNRWLGTQASGEPVEIATGSADLGSQLKRSLSYFRKAHNRKRS